jgi:hypothetical protein
MTAAAERIDFPSMMMPVALRLLGEPLEKHRRGTEWRYRGRGSLKVDIAKGIWHDFEANIGGGVIELIVRHLGYDHDGAVAWLQREGILETPENDRDLKKRFVCAYDYLSEGGKLLFQSVRYQNPKTFRYRRPALKTDDWIWNLRDVPLVPYQLPSLVEAVAAGAVIFIPEGEKDVETLRALGFAATTNPGGAGKWQKDFSEFFRGANVILIADNDEPGRTHSDQIAASLNGTAARIRILDLGALWPECPPKGDISEWRSVVPGRLEEIAAKLREMVEQSPDWKPADETRDRPSHNKDEEAEDVHQPNDEAGQREAEGLGDCERAWPVLDEAAYYGLAGDFVKALDPHTEADPAGILMQFVTMFGNIIGNNPYYQIESDRHHTNLFSVQVGATAKGRKGTSAGRVKAVTMLADRMWVDERMVSGLSSGEGLISAVSDPVEKWDAKAKLFVTVDPGVADKRLMITEPEFAGALSVMERHGNTLSPVIRNAWDGQRLQTLTRASPMKATGAHISIVAHITETEARARLSRTEMANGFANRFLFCCVKRSKLLPHGGNLDERVLADLCLRFKNAVDYARQVGRVEMTDEAVSAWSAVYPKLSREQPGLVGAVIARAEAQVIRLALIFALLDGRDAIAFEHLEAALAVWTFCEASALRIFGDSLGDPVADDILQALRESGPSGMTRTDIYNFFGRHRRSDQIGAALQLLLKTGRVRSKTRKTAGRTSETYIANLGGRT